MAEEKQAEVERLPDAKFEALAAEVIGMAEDRYPIPEREATGVVREARRARKREQTLEKALKALLKELKGAVVTGRAGKEERVDAAEKAARAALEG